MPMAQEQAELGQSSDLDKNTQSARPSAAQAQTKPTGPALSSPPQHAQESSSTGALGAFGLLLFIGGVIGLIYFWEFFDTSVNAPGSAFFGGSGRVHNIGLMQDKQSGLIISGIAAALGVVCILVSQYGGKRS
jgi:hypothetical protein